MEPIPYYLNYNIYAYYRNPNHIIFDENLSYLLKNNIFPIKVSNTHMRFYHK